VVGDRRTSSSAIRELLSSALTLKEGRLQPSIELTDAVVDNVVPAGAGRRLQRDVRRAVGRGHLDETLANPDAAPRPKAARGHW
jgi:hypothetical protein